MPENPESIKEEIKALLESRGRSDKSGTESNLTSNEITIQEILFDAYYLIEGGFSDKPDIFQDANIGTWDPTTRTATLTKDISKPIQILIDNVTLTAAIDSNTHLRYKISNSGDYGIYINSTPVTRKKITISSMEISFCRIGIYAFDTTNLIIQENGIHDIFGDGIQFNANNNSNTVQGNSVYNCKSSGIILGSGNRWNTIIKNDFNNNNYGVYFGVNNDSNLVKENNIFENTTSGIYLYLDNDSNTMQKNSIFTNTDGITLVSDNNLNVIQNNSMYKNNDYGIHFITENDSNTVEYNFINGNGTEFHDTGIKFDENNNSNTIQYNNIYENNDTGIDFHRHNETNIIQYNNIYENIYAGIDFGGANNSNKIQHNKIYKNHEYGIQFSDDNYSNNILCNCISDNVSDSSTSIYGGGIHTHGDNNLVKRNNFKKNEPNNTTSDGRNTYTGNYWSDWSGNGPYIFDGVTDNNPSRFPVSCTIFKQFSVQEYLTIPLQKPCAEEIQNCLVQVEIEQVKVIKNPSAMSYEGQILRGNKAIIEGSLHQKIEYIADDSSQPVHAAHFTSPFSTFIMLPEDYAMGTPLHINSIIEDVYYKLLDKRRIFKNVTLYLEAKEM